MLVLNGTEHLDSIYTTACTVDVLVNVYVSAMWYRSPSYCIYVLNDTDVLCKFNTADVFCRCPS